MQLSQDSQDSQELVPAAVQVFGDYKLLVKILSGIYGIPGFPKGTRGPSSSGSAARAEAYGAQQQR
jgi:hypothetical protein